MKEEFEKALERFAQEMAEVDLVVHSILKGHLLLEEALTRIINLHIFHWEHVDGARLSFSQRLKLCRALCLRKSEYGIWELMESINGLRNELAHNLQSPGRDKKMQRLKQVYAREIVGSPFLDLLPTQEDYVVVAYACGVCMGFLNAYEADAKSYRALLHSMDRTLNPDQPDFKM